MTNLLAPDAASPVPGPAEQRSTRAAFFIAGFGMAAWAPLVPYAKERLAIGEGTLGLLLLCLGAGSIATMPVAGVLAARFGCRRAIWAASLVICAALPLLATAGSIPLLAAALMLFGAGVGTVPIRPPPPPPPHAAKASASSELAPRRRTEKAAGRGRRSAIECMGRRPNG